MKLLVVDLYITVFDFLSFAMDWYGSSSKRFKASFNQNFTTESTKKVNAVKSVLARIRQEATQATQDRIQDTREGVEIVHQGVTSIDAKMENMTQELQDLKQHLMSSSRTGRQNDIDPSMLMQELVEGVAMWMLGQKATQSLLATGQARKYRRLSLILFFSC